MNELSTPREMYYEPFVKIREFFSDPNRWSQNAAARDKDNKVVSRTDPKACKFCLSTGINVILKTYYPYLNISTYKLFLAEYMPSRYNNSLIKFNDEATYSGLLNFLDNIIEDIKNKRI